MRRRLIARVLIGWGAVVAILGGGVYALVATNALAVNEIRVEGVRLADQASVKETLVASAREGRMRGWIGPELIPFWFFLDPPSSFFAAYPMFKSAEVDVQLFARTVAIRVTERALYGTWCIKSGTCYAFDEGGTVFGEVPTLEGVVVSKIADERTAPFAPGESVIPEGAWRERFFETLEVLARLKLTPRAITVRDYAVREWDVALAEGPLLKFSFMFVPERLEEALQTISRRADFRGMEYLDFRVQDRLFYK